MRIFKAETKALRDGDDIGDQARQVQAAQQAPMQQAPMQQPPGQQPPAQQAAPPAPDGTVVSGVPLAEAQRNQQSS